MFRAMTLIELMITFIVMIISIYFLSPLFFRIQEPILLNNEIDHIKSFIYYVQTQARYQQKRYSITINQNKLNNHWCIVAVEKNSSKETACDCLNISHCVFTSTYHLYSSALNTIQLKSGSLYPNVFMNIDGIAGRLETICLGLIGSTSQKVLQFDSNGVINVAQENKRTKCR